MRIIKHFNTGIYNIMFLLLFLTQTSVVQAKSIYVQTSFTTQELVVILKEKYDNVQVLGDKQVAFTIDKHSYGIEGWSNGFTILFVSNVPMSYKRINQWNNEMRYPRAYIGDNKVILDMQVVGLQTGLNKQHIFEAIDTMHFGVRVFMAARHEN